tara:strand:+ start:1589 stop:1903 length:315 start_codon:yes stop_codon:yes gene_type:complete
MAQSLEDIKASFTPPTHTVVDGVQIELTAEEIDSKLDDWAENERARQLDIDANGYKYDREAAYPALAEQFDKLFHDINNGTLDETGEFFTALKTVKDDNPKPSE